MKAKINAGLTLSKASLLFGFVFGASLVFANPGETTDPNQTALIEPTAESDLALPRELPELEPLLAHPRTSMVIVEQLRRNHYVTKAINDDLSSVVLDNYLKALDGGRYYFLATDVSEFEAYRYKLDDTLKKGDLDPAFTIFNRFQTRVSERLHYLLALIGGGLETLDFEQDEYIEVDRAAAAWPIDLPAQNELWRRRLKAQVLNMTLGDKTLDEIATTLEKRYRNQLKIAMRNRSEDAFQTFMNAFASSFDPHTQYFSPRSSENFNINMSLSLEGIGAVLQTEEDATSVVRLVPAGPADKSGQIKPSDKIIEVGQGTDGPMIDVVGWRLDDVVELIRGPKGSTVRLTVVSGGAEDKESTVVTIERNTIKLEEQAAQAKVITLQDGTEQRRIGVLQIPTFYADFEAQQRGDRDYRSTTRDARRLISELKQTGIDGLIVDLRSNGGGSLQEADSLTGLFLESGPTVQVKTARRRPSVYKNGSSDLVWDGPMAVMVNRLSASASEIFAGALQDYGRALVIGGQTFGKGTVQTLIPLNRGQLKLTAAKFYRVSGQSTQHQGVIPDIAFPALVDNDNIGESTLDDAMPWDMIKPARFTPFSELQDYIPLLQAKHNQRAVNDPHFIYYESLMERSKARSGRELISLKRTVRENEKADDDAWRLALENQLREATGDTPIASLDELDDLEEDAAEEDAPLGKIVEVADDPMLTEAGKILADLITVIRDEPNPTTLASQHEWSHARPTNDTLTEG